MKLFLDSAAGRSCSCSDIHNHSSSRTTMVAPNARFNSLLTLIPRSLAGAGLALCLGTAPVLLGQDHGGGGDSGMTDSQRAEYPYEWGGVYALPKGVSNLVLQPGPDATIDIALVPLDPSADESFGAAVATATKVFAGNAAVVEPGGEIIPGAQLYQLRVDGDAEMRFRVATSAAGRFALFTQHFADEFQTTFLVRGKKSHPIEVRNFREPFGQIEISPDAMATFGIELGAAGKHTLTPASTSPARVAFNRDRVAHLGSLVVGRVAELPVAQGSRVKAGDVLLVVDSPELGLAQSAFLRKKTLAETAVPLVALARSAFERAKALHAKSGISLNEVQKRQADYQKAESALLNARAELLEARNTLSILGMSEADTKALAESQSISARYSVRAPISGVLITRDVALGQLVTTSSERLLVVADLSTLWVHAEVSELDLASTAVGSHARVTVSALPGVTFQGGVSFVSPVIDERSRTAVARIELDNADGALRPGMFAEAEVLAKQGIEGASQEAVLAVPESTVQVIDGRPVVFVPYAGKPNTYLKRPVTVGPPVGGMLPVKYGLRAGERIVLSGTFLLKAQLGKSGAKHGH